MDNIHIMGPMNELSYAFNHLSTQLAQVGLKVKVSKCKFWGLSRISPGIKILHDYTLVIDGLHILGVLVSFPNFAMHFFDEILSEDMVHINDLPFLGNAHYFGHFVFMCNS
jgi:hypothetical protein